LVAKQQDALAEIGAPAVAIFECIQFFEVGQSRRWQLVGCGGSLFRRGAEVRDRADHRPVADLLVLLELVELAHGSSHRRLDDERLRRLRARRFRRGGRCGGRTTPGRDHNSNHRSQTNSHD
jgi:hypothetical protein